MQRGFIKYKWFPNTKIKIGIINEEENFNWQQCVKWGTMFEETNNFTGGFYGK